MKPASLRHLITSLTLVAMCSAGCDISDLTSITFTEEGEEVVIQGRRGTLLGSLPFLNFFPPMKLDINLRAELDAQDAGPAKEVFLENMRIIIITDRSRSPGDNDNFDFVEEVTVFVESNGRDSKLPRVQVAQARSIPKGATVMEFNVDKTVDLKPYIEEGLRLTTQGRGEQPPTDVSIQPIVGLRVTLL